MNAKRNIVGALIMAGAVMLLPAAGHAEFGKPAEPESLAVSFADLNLNSEAGARTLMNRIEAAAGKVCGGEPNRYELHRQSRFKSCVREATDRAVMDVNASTVTALYANEVKDAFTSVDRASYSRD